MTDAVSPTIISTVIGLGGLLAGVIGTAVRVTAKLAQVKEDLTEKMNSDTAELRTQLTEEHDAVMKQFGDSLSAMREKIRDTEIWNRDNFVRRPDFDRAIDTLTARMDAGFTEIKAMLRDREAPR